MANYHTQTKHTPQHSCLLAKWILTLPCTLTLPNHHTVAFCTIMSAGIACSVFFFRFRKLSPCSCNWESFCIFVSVDTLWAQKRSVQCRSVWFGTHLFHLKHLHKSINLEWPHNKWPLSRPEYSSFTSQAQQIIPLTSGWWRPTSDQSKQRGTSWGYSPPRVCVCVCQGWTSSPRETGWRQPTQEVQGIHLQP